MLTDKGAGWDRDGVTEVITTSVPSSAGFSSPARWVPAALRRFAALLLPLILLSPTPAFGQSFGQWWWTASVGANQRITETKSDGSARNRRTITELVLSTALNGFLLHPAVGNFSLDVDLLTQNNSGTQALDRDRIGYGANFNLFQRGKIPLNLFARRRHFNHPGLGDQGFASSYRVPDSSVLWGGRTGVRRGAFRGLTLEFDHLATDYEDSSSQSHDRQLVDWSRSGRRFQHHVRVWHLARAYGVSDTRFDDLTATLSQRGMLAPTWDWNLSGSAFRREISTAGAPSVLVDTGNLGASVSHPMRRRDLLTLRATVAQVRPDATPGTFSYNLSSDYRWKLGPSWDITPGLAFTRLDRGTTSLQSSRMRLSATWNRHVGLLDTLLTATTSFGMIDSNDSTQTKDEQQVALGIAGSLGHGMVRRLRKEIEFEISRNELRLTADPIEDLPDLGLPTEGLATQDRFRARVTLNRSWNRGSANGWFEWRRRQSTGDIGPPEVEADSYTGTLGYNARTFDLRGNVGQTVSTRAGAETQQVRFTGAHAIWRPTRYLDVRASFRDDKRMTRFAPDLDGRQFQTTVILHIGLLDVAVSALQFTNDLDGEIATTRRNLNWSIRRRFGGLLPIVTGTQRSGVIR